MDKFMNILLGDFLISSTKFFLLNIHINTYRHTHTYSLCFSSSLSPLLLIFKLLLTTIYTVILWLLIRGI